MRRLNFASSAFVLLCTALFSGCVRENIALGKPDATDEEIWRALAAAQAMYRQMGYREIPPYNDNPYAHHWFEKRL